MIFSGCCEGAERSCLTSIVLNVSVLQNRGASRLTVAGTGGSEPCLLRAVLAVFDGSGLTCVGLCCSSLAVLTRAAVIGTALAVVEDLSEQTDAGMGKSGQLLDAQAVLFP